MGGASNTTTAAMATATSSSGAVVGEGMHRAARMAMVLLIVGLAIIGTFTLSTNMWIAYQTRVSPPTQVVTSPFPPTEGSSSSLAGTPVNLSTPFTAERDGDGDHRSHTDEEKEESDDSRRNIALRGGTTTPEKFDRRKEADGQTSKESQSMQDTTGGIEKIGSNSDQGTNTRSKYLPSTHTQRYQEPCDGEDCSAEVEAVQIETVPQKTFWGSDDLKKNLHKGYQYICSKKEKRHPRMKRVESVTRANPETLLQKSVLADGVGHSYSSTEELPQAKTTEFSAPACDLRECDQSRFPFIYFLLPERNRVGSAARMITSMNNATKRCDVAPWLPCLCFYVVDYQTPDTSVIDRLKGLWPGHIRVLRKRAPTDPWMKTQTLLFGAQSIPTPEKRSLVFHVDADLVALDDAFVDNALRLIDERPRAYLPIITTTKKEIQTVDELWRHAIKTDTPHITWRMPGVGMVFYLLGDFRTQFPSKSVNKASWGGEDWDFYMAIRRKISTLRKKERWLVHIYHPKVEWTKSTDGITLDKE